MPDRALQRPERGEPTRPESTPAPALRKAPDAAAGLAGEALVDGELPDPRGEPVARQVNCRSQIRDRRGRRPSLADEEGQRDLVVVAEVVVAVLDRRDAEERAAGQQLDHVEGGVREEPPGGGRLHEVGGGGRGRGADGGRGSWGPIPRSRGARRTPGRRAPEGGREGCRAAPGWSPAPRRVLRCSFP